MGNTLNLKKKKKMDSSDSKKLRNHFNNDWRTQETSLVDQLRHLYHNGEETNVVYVFNRNDSITVFTYSYFLQHFCGNKMFLQIILCSSCLSELPQFQGNNSTGVSVSQMFAE